jgi:hypothetical protein
MSSFLPWSDGSPVSFGTLTATPLIGFSSLVTFASIALSNGVAECVAAVCDDELPHAVAMATVNAAMITAANLGLRGCGAAGPIARGRSFLNSTYSSLILASQSQLSGALFVPVLTDIANSRK